MNNINTEKLKAIAMELRYYSLVSTTEAGSGHPTSCLSIADIMAVLMFNGDFKYFIDNPNHPNNDRLIFSKGHAAPLFYSLWALAGGIKRDELLTLRKFNSILEGHPTPLFPYTDVATGSLGQGLSAGVGMALNAKYLDNLPYNTYVLLGDGELTEGSNWEAAALASHYKLNNLTAIVDINKLEQTEPTMYEWDLGSYINKFEAFGWRTIILDEGHNLIKILEAFEQRKKIMAEDERPIAIIAKTIKGKGVSFIEDKINWHGKVLTKEELSKALEEIGMIRKPTEIIYEITKPEDLTPLPLNNVDISTIEVIKYNKGDIIATRKAYGNSLVRLGKQYSNLIVMDGGTQNSTFAETFQKAFPERFFPMYIAEQNMVSTALSLSKRGKIPFISTFAVFFTRAFDQIRMSEYSNGNIKFVGSHSGVSIGEDGSSQMALEDIAMFRTLFNSVVLYPSDAVATDKLVEEAAKHKGNVFIRTTRKDAPVIYDSDEKFIIGGSKIVKESVYDLITIVGAGVTLHEAIKAYNELIKENIFIRIVDLYSIKPLDIKTLTKCIRETKGLLIVEDHYPEGGIAEAVRSAIDNAKTRIYSLAVNKMPRSGKPDELLDYEEISYKAIISKIKEAINL